MALASYKAKHLIPTLSIIRRFSAHANLYCKWIREPRFLRTNTILQSANAGQMQRLDPPKTYFLGSWVCQYIAQDTPNVFEIGMAFPVRRSKTKRKSQPSRSAPFHDSYTALFNQFKIDGELIKKDVSTNMVQISGSQKRP